jgi:hypothetical protein
LLLVVAGGFSDLPRARNPCQEILARGTGNPRNFAYQWLARASSAEIMMAMQNMAQAVPEWGIICLISDAEKIHTAKMLLCRF